MNLAEAAPTRILVVDDEQQIRRALTSILSTLGYALDMAATAEEALIKAVDRPPPFADSLYAGRGDSRLL